MCGPPQCGAVSFIENLRAKNLRIEEEEFNLKMGFVDGRTDVDLYLAEGEVQEEEDQERVMVLEVGLTLFVVIHLFLSPSLPLSLSPSVPLPLSLCPSPPLSLYPCVPLSPSVPLPLSPSVPQSCTERMKELTGQLREMLGEMDDLSRKMTESTRGLTDQVSTILSMPPPRVLYRSPRAGQGGGATRLPPGRSTLQAPKRGRGHERKGSGDKRPSDRRGFTSTL